MNECFICGFYRQPYDESNVTGISFEEHKVLQRPAGELPSLLTQSTIPFILFCSFVLVVLVVLRT